MPQDINSNLRIAGIYTIVHTASRRAYVGQTINWEYRKYQHKRGLETRTHGNDRLQKAWNKHGAESFEFILILTIEGLEGNNLKKKLNEEEIRICSKFPLLFNLKVPGNACMIPSALTRKRMSKAISASHARPEFRKKLRKAIKEAWKNPEYREKLIQSAKLERNSIEGKARMKKIIIQAYADPKFRKKHKAATKAAWKDPEAKAKRIAAFNTPQGKANRAAAAKIGWLKRKAKN